MFVNTAEHRNSVAKVNSFREKAAVSSPVKNTSTKNPYATIDVRPSNTKK